jgi:hypothetical protein
MQLADAMRVLAAVAELAEEEREKLPAPPPASWCPHEPTGKQAEALRVDAMELLYGGAAGGGKSDFLLMAALEYVDRPNYAALILRRSYKDLALPDAIMERSHRWLRGTPAKWNPELKQWKFPSGATLTFSYLAHEGDKYQYQGAAFQFIAFDELTQFTETQYTYLLSRLRRRADEDIPLRQRSASNPGGNGHAWVLERFVDPDTRGSRRFVPARLDDNPHLDREEYRATLSRMDDTTRRQLELGEWITNAGELIYPVNVANMVPALPEGPWDYALATDLGASITKPTTAMQVIACSTKSPFVYLVESAQMALGSPGAIAELLRMYTERYNLMSMPVDPGGLGIGYIREFQDRYHLPVEEAKNRNKLGYRKLMRGDLERGLIKIVEPTNRALLREMATLRWNEGETDCVKGAQDHATDACLYAYITAYHYLHAAEPTGPKPGSVEAREAEADRQLERVADEDNYM